MDPFAALRGSRYASLATYRKSGAGVPTPVWFARPSDGPGDRLYVVTGRHTGKAKRIRNDPRVTLRPCDFRGKPSGGGVRALARLVDDEGVSALADRALREKYGWQYRAFLRVEALRGAADDMVFLELLPKDRPDA